MKKYVVHGPPDKRSSVEVAMEMGATRKEAEALQRFAQKAIRKFLDSPEGRKLTKQKD